MNFLKRHARPIAIALIALFGVTGALIAQERAGETAGSDGANSFEVTGIVVDTRGDSANEARAEGWREAQRRGWRTLWARLNRSSPNRAPGLSDSTLDGIVGGIIVEEEQIGVRRYRARLGVAFDRARASQILGVSGPARRSPPLLVIPIQWTGGAPFSFEETTEWHSAWIRFQSAGSPIEYVRVRGTGPDPLLLNVSQTRRPGRGWWRFLLDSYGAADVIVPEVRLRYSYPGGPVIGNFVAWHGPDRRKITEFALRVASQDALPALLDAGVRRMDQAYAQALREGRLAVDPSLFAELPVDEELEEELEDAFEEPALGPQIPMEEGTAETVTYSIQVSTPDGAALRSAETLVRAAPGVRSALTSSLAIGGVSLMRVRFDGDLDALAAALASRGFEVRRGTGTLRISRPAAAPAEPPANESGE